MIFTDLWHYWFCHRRPVLWILTMHSNLKLLEDSIIWSSLSLSLSHSHTHTHTHARMHKQTHTHMHTFCWLQTFRHFLGHQTLRKVVFFQEITLSFMFMLDCEELFSPPSLCSSSFLPILYSSSSYLIVIFYPPTSFSSSSSFLLPSFLFPLSSSLLPPCYPFFHHLLWIKEIISSYGFHSNFKQDIWISSHIHMFLLSLQFLRYYSFSFMPLFFSL